MKKIFLIFLITLLTGCGYSTRSLLPDNYRTIFVEPFENKIDYMNADDRKLYVPGMETKVRDAIVDRYLFDGNLRVGTQDGADLVLQGKLLSFAREELRLDTSENVREYRIRITVGLILSDPSGKKELWAEPSFSGEATYYTTGSLAKSETQAIEDALKDLALRVVARTIEDW
jgi:outer membrane lipopolysaccharide assembly protein LptE/RlpB